MSDHIGVSNIYCNRLKRLIEKTQSSPYRIRYIENEFHLFLPNTKLLQLCGENGIRMIAYSPLGQRMFPQYSREIRNLIGDSTPSQFMISYCLKNNTIPIPSSKDIQRMRENFQEIDIDDDVLEMLNKRDSEIPLIDIAQDSYFADQLVE
jgi:diketogulonate reductase-like aldo/keto reductase